MVVEKVGLPIHKDAQLKVRQRIFLEGNFFVDVQPGTAGSGELEKGGSIPVNQTDTPVQFGADPDRAPVGHARGPEDAPARVRPERARRARGREDRRPVLQRIARPSGGRLPERVDRERRDARTAPGRPATRDPLAAEGLQGTLDPPREPEGPGHEPERHRARSVERRGGAPGFGACAAGHGACAVARRWPSWTRRCRRCARSPATPCPERARRSATLRASRPFIRQARLLVSEDELRGLTRDLRPTIPALARVNRSSIGLLDEIRALSACQNEVLVPFATTPIPDPDFPENSGQTFCQAGPARVRRARRREPPVRRELAGVPHPVRHRRDHGRAGRPRREPFFAQAAEPPAGIRPIRPNQRPKFRPDVPCETQEPPDLNAPGGQPSQSFTPGPSNVTGAICDLVGGDADPVPSRQAARTVRLGPAPAERDHGPHASGVRPASRRPTR